MSIQPYFLVFFRVFRPIVSISGQIYICITNNRCLLYIHVFNLDINVTFLFYLANQYNGQIQMLYIYDKYMCMYVLIYLSQLCLSESNYKYIYMQMGIIKQGLYLLPTIILSILLKYLNTYKPYIKIRLHVKICQLYYNILYE